MNRSSLWIGLLSALLFWACLGNESSVQYQTRYQVDLMSIDNRLTLDSATFVVSVDGVIQDSVSFTTSDLADRLVSLPTLVGSEGDSIRIVYTVWSQGKIVAQGADAFMVSDAANASQGDLVLDDGNITLLIEALIPIGSSSSALSSSSADGASSATGSSSSAASSSSAIPEVVASCGSDARFNIGFLTNTATLAEGDTVIRLLLGGTQGSKLATPQTITLQVSSGSTDVTFTNTTVTLLANDSACTVYEVPVNVIQDQLVEGTENAQVQIINFSSALSAGTYQSLPLTLLDRDSAWVTLTFDEAITETDAEKNIMGTATLHTSNSAKLAKTATFSLETAAGTTLAASDYALGTGYQFDAQSENGQTLTVSWALKGNDTWDDARTLNLQAVGPALVAPPSGTAASMDIANDDMEYIVLLFGDNEVEFHLLDPVGNSKAKLAFNDMYLENSSTVANYSVVTALGKDTLFNQDAYQDHALVSLTGTTPSIRNMETQNAGIIDADSWSGTDLHNCRMIASVGSYIIMQTYCSTSKTFSQELMYNQQSFAVAIDPNSTAVNPTFYALTTNGLFFYDQWSTISMNATIIDRLSYGFGDDIAISPSGHRLIVKSGALDIDGLSLSVTGWTSGSYVKLLATPRETFWLFTVGTGGLTATEISTSGTILHGPLLVGGVTNPMNVMPKSVTLLRSDKVY